MKAIENLMSKRGKFDYILLETTGLADPGKIFFSEMYCVLEIPLKLMLSGTIIYFLFI